MTCSNSLSYGEFYQLVRDPGLMTQKDQEEVINLFRVRFSYKDRSTLPDLIIVPWQKWWRHNFSSTALSSPFIIIIIVNITISATIRLLLIIIVITTTDLDWVPKIARCCRENPLYFRAKFYGAYVYRAWMRFVELCFGMKYLFR